MVIIIAVLMGEPRTLPPHAVVFYRAFRSFTTVLRSLSLCPCFLLA